MVIFGSAPFSNILAASVRRLCFMLVLRIVLASKQADSRNMCWVSVVTPLDSPPKTPAIHNPVRSPSQIIKSSDERLRVSWSRETKGVLSCNFDTTIFLPDIFIASNACRGCPNSFKTKLVISTILLMGLTPIAFNKFFNHCGDSPTVTLLMVIPLYRGQACLSKTSTSIFKATF